MSRPMIVSLSGAYISYGGNPALVTAVIVPLESTSAGSSARAASFR